MKDLVAGTWSFIPSWFGRAKVAARTGVTSGVGSCFIWRLLYTEQRQAPLDESSALDSSYGTGQVVDNSAIY